MNGALPPLSCVSGKSTLTGHTSSLNAGYPFGATWGVVWKGFHTTARRHGVKNLQPLKTGASDCCVRFLHL